MISSVQSTKWGAPCNEVRYYVPEAEFGGRDPRQIVSGELDVARKLCVDCAALHRVEVVFPAGNTVIPGHLRERDAAAALTNVVSTPATTGAICLQDKRQLTADAATLPIHSGG